MAERCLCLTGSTLADDFAALERYRDLVDMVELRVDYLEPQEKFHIRSFPEKAGLPCILTARRRVDGGRFDEGEGVRLVLLAKGLAYASDDPQKNFAYIDLEEDFRVPALEEAARIFGTRIIRSCHDPDGVPDDLGAMWDSVSREPGEIPKIAVHPRGTGDVLRIFEKCASIGSRERIVVGMGDYGFCTRLLASKTGSTIQYASATGAGMEAAAPGQIDPDLLEDVYRTRLLGDYYALYGILGGPSVIGALSPRIHNAGFAGLGIEAVYIPFPADDLAAFFRLADILDIRGFSVTAPYKEKILPYLSSRSPEVERIGACNTVVRTEHGWTGYNTDTRGFGVDVLRFIGRENLEGIRVCIVGAGGAARAVAQAVKTLGGEACIVNRTMWRAKALAERFGFEWAGQNERAVEMLGRYSDLIVQTTSMGMNGGVPGDPLELYEFTGREAVYDLIYNPRETPFLARAREAGCRCANGIGMLREQAAEQFELFTGTAYPSDLEPIE
ncbi:MAG: type I 3-dehydroquinate dehydratase [Spirochaetes bacterium]|nr:type I 3-dehydroquinate dehydratase [Spirochaetota bacterium]